jgi:putative acetyltransferase
MDQMQPNGENFFIRRYREADEDEVLRLWLKESLHSHTFLPARFWGDYRSMVKQIYLREWITYVAEKDGKIAGLISLTGNYVAALFVGSEYQRQGIGKALLGFIHKIQGSLFVDVYKENTPALNFYINYGFQPRREKEQPETGHTIITMFLATKKIGNKLTEND